LEFKKFSDWLGEEKAVMEVRGVETQLQQVEVSGSGAFLS